MAVTVRTPQFEGPLDLLRHLILRQEIDVCDISLSKLVDDYLLAVERMEPFDLESASEFLLGAAVLVALKSRRLLPSAPDAEADDDFEEFDGRDRLLALMLECETFRRAGAALERLAEQAELSAPRRVGPEEHYLGLLPDLLAEVEPADLAAACGRALQAALPQGVDLSHVGGDELQVGDVMADLILHLPVQGPTTFAELTRPLPGRREVVVHFLALLELFKQNRVDLRQDGPLGRIVVEWCEEPAVPRAEEAAPGLAVVG